MATVLTSDQLAQDALPHLHFPHRDLLKQTSTHLVSNVKTTLAGLCLEDKVWLLTVNHAEYQNSLICSPYTTYVTYPLGELKKFKNPLIKSAILLNAGFMSLLCRLTRFNQVVQVNNNLNSLIQHPSQFAQHLSRMTTQLKEVYPQHSITFFRVNEKLNGPLLNALKEQGYWVFPDRSVHLFMPQNHFMERSYVKRDLILLKKSPYQMVQHDELTETDAPRLAALYRALFVDKHSSLNPIYTETYFRLALKNRWHEYVALRNEAGRLDAFISWFQDDSVMSCGPLGYDMSVGSKAGLYRQLVALCLQKAHESKFIFNMGGGSDTFKLNRGSETAWEYTAIFCAHLPVHRRLPWKILSTVFNRCLKKVVGDVKL